MQLSKISVDSLLCCEAARRRIGIPGEKWRGVVLLEDWSDRLANAALAKGLMSYFEKPVRLQTVHRASMALAISTLTERYPRVDQSLLYGTLGSIRRTRVTPYSKRLPPNDLTEFLSSQGEAIRKSEVSGRAKVLALTALERVTREPDQMDAYADMVFLIMSVDFVLRCSGMSLEIRPLWDAEMLRTQGIVTPELDDGTQTSLLSFSHPTEADHEGIWEAVERLLGGDVSPSPPHFLVNLLNHQEFV